MAIMAKYGPRTAPMGQHDRPADHFARALGEWMGAMQAEPTDKGRTMQRLSRPNAAICFDFSQEMKANIAILGASLVMQGQIALASG
jgi:hypothetical protein